MSRIATSADADILRDPDRLAVLHATGLLDSPPEETFDRFTRMASMVLDLPVTLVTLIDAERQFFKSHIGLDGELAETRQTPLSHSFCKHLVIDPQPLVIVDSRLHALVRDNPAVEEYNSIAYLGIPLTTTQGQTLGSFCAVRSEPYQWSEREITVMRALAHAVITEIELRLLASQFRDSYHELRTLSLQRDEMIDMLVHDLRNPLSSLIAGMHLVRDDNPLTPAQQRALDIAQRGGETLLAMINDLLDSSRAKAVGMQLDLGPVAITEVCQAALEQVTHLAERSGVRLETDIALGLPPLRADRGKLRRVLVNLLANAIQHTPAGGMVSLEARADAGGRTLELIVSDTGLGIAPQQVDSLFDKYGTSSSSPGQTHSTGLGLPFCKLVAEAHGGDIQVASSISHGASFRLTLPLPARTH